MGRRFSMCTDDKAFTIRDTKECVKRGYKRTGFFEVDTGEERDWTVRLTDPEGEAKIAMRRNRRVKIVATLGPASNNEETMRALFEAGADVFRVNMSHATHDGLRDLHRHPQDRGRNSRGRSASWSICKDPKLRIGKFDSGAIRLTEGDILSFVRREAIGGLGRVHLPHPEIFQAVAQATRFCSTTASSGSESSRQATSGSTPRC